MHFVYHKTASPKVVTTDEYSELLNTGEWFDRPQTNLIKGNSDAIRSILIHKDEQRKEPGHKRCERGTPSKRNDVHEGSPQEGNESKQDESSKEKSDEKAGLLKPKRKRGRPRKNEVTRDAANTEDSK